MSFEAKLPVHRAELEGRLEEATAVRDELKRVNKYAARLDVAKVKG